MCEGCCSSRRFAAHIDRLLLLLRRRRRRRVVRDARDDGGGGGGGDCVHVCVHVCVRKGAKGESEVFLYRWLVMFCSVGHPKALALTGQKTNDSDA